MRDSRPLNCSVPATPFRCSLPIHDGFLVESPLDPICEGIRIHSKRTRTPPSLAPVRDDFWSSAILWDRVRKQIAGRWSRFPREWRVLHLSGIPNGELELLAPTSQALWKASLFECRFPAKRGNNPLPCHGRLRKLEGHFHKSEIRRPVATFCHPQATDNPSWQPVKIDLRHQVHRFGFSRINRAASFFQPR